jgi:hypothetical protein
MQKTRVHIHWLGSLAPPYEDPSAFKHCPPAKTGLLNHRLVEYLNLMHLD